MKPYPALLAALLAAGALSAAPVPVPAPPSGPPGGQAVKAEAVAFAQQLLSVAGQVADGYVRPVPREELLYAALAGLYQGARLPVPADLRPRLKKALAAVPSKPLPDGGTVGGRLTVFVPTGGPLVELLQWVREDVGNAEGLRGQNALLVCCRSMTRVLDPYSTVVTAEEQRRSIGLDQECEGVGLELAPSAGAGPLRVGGVQLGGPAQRAGLRPGDEITHLDGRPVKDAPPATQLRLRNRVPGTSAVLVPGGADGQLVPEVAPPAVRVTFRRSGAPPRTVALERECFRPETVLGVARRDNNAWEYFADRERRIAHVRIATLGQGTADELRGVLEDLKDDGMRGLVLDLRWCPGGFLTEATGVAELFVGEGVLATVRARGKEPTVYRSTAEGKFLGFPLVVLVNGETMGGAELIAAALQDHRRALVVGQRTLGKASVQTLVPLPLPGVGLKLTSGTFERPSGKNLHRFPDSKPADDWGVRPDADGECRVSPELGRRLREWWGRQSLRPGASNERLPLDDPSADPQRQAAVEAVARLLEQQPQARAK
jgi:C-terminal processing protease CtpA/Prc